MTDIVDKLMAMRANYTYSVAATFEEAALEIKTLRTALEDAINSPKGVVPESAEKFWDGHAGRVRQTS